MIDKKSLVFIFGIFFLFTFINIVSAESMEMNYSYSYSYEGIQITLLTYEPYPVNPGEYFDVWIKASIGSNIDYVKFKLVDTFPFSLDGSEDPVREYEDINSREVVMHYKVRVDENAVEGVNELDFQIITSKAYEGETFFLFEIYVADAQTDFDLVVQDSSDSEISLAIANIGKNIANSMIVRIPTQEGYTVTGTSGQMVGNLDSGDYTIVSFEVSQTGRNSENLLQIQIDYTDSIGERRSVIKEIDFGSGNLVNMSISEEDILEGFEGMNGFSGGNFPGQQKKAKWPYFLAIGLVLIFAGFIFYGKYKRKIKKFIKERKEEKLSINKKTKTTSLPEWMIKETKKIDKKR